jgi:hypothetical protein
MACQRCNELLAAYKHAVSVFTKAEWNMRGTVEDDFRLALNKLRLLHKACLNANAAVTEHWRQDHNSYHPAP